MRELIALSIVITMVSLGCQQADGPPATVEQTDAKPDASIRVSDIAVDANSLPDVVVAAFLDAIREGDDQIARALLSDRARQSIAENDLKLQPPGSPSATYKITGTRHTDGAAHVESTWTEFAATGEEIVYRILWVVHQQADGWRVTGMAASPTPDSSLVFLNFEDIPDLKQKWQQADEELAAQAEEPIASQAERAGSTFKR